MTIPNDTPDISDRTRPTSTDGHPRIEEWTIKKRLLYQFIATETISIFSHGLNGHWMAGVFAPIWAVCLPFAVYGPLSDSITRQMVIPAIGVVILLMIVGFSLLKRIGAVYGHIALLLFNVVSMILLLTFK